MPSLNESFFIVKPFPNGAIQLSFRYVDNNEPQSLLPDRYSISDTRNQTIEMIELDGRNTSISLMIRNLISSQSYSFIVTPYSLYNNTWHRGIPTQQTEAVLPGRMHCIEYCLTTNDRLKMMLSVLAKIICLQESWLYLNTVMLIFSCKEYINYDVKVLLW